MQIALNYLDCQMADVAYPLQGVQDGIPLDQLHTFQRRVFVRGQIADRLAGGGTADRQQQKDITRTVLEFAP